MRHDEHRNADLLRDVPLFQACRRRELKHLAELAEEIHLPAGRRLLTQGEAPHDGCYVVVRGSVAVLRGAARIAVAGPGDVLGELALLDGAPRRADAVTVTPTRVLRFSHCAFSRLQQSPLVGARLRSLYRHRELVPAPRRAGPALVHFS
jgi:CRP-like cAMP-binding protein